MSQFIFDEIYGSEAKKKKIMENNNFLYYRQMMKLKHKHVNNPSLYSHIYEAPTHELTLNTSKYKSQYSPDFLKTLDQSNYAIQKLNAHAFKIVKRKQKVPLLQNNQNKLLKFNLQNRNVLTPGSKLTSRSIDRDAKDLRNYFSRQQQSVNKSRNTIRNSSLDFSAHNTLKSNSKWRKSEFQTSRYSTINPSRFQFKTF